MPLIMYGVERSPPCRTVLVVAKALGLDITLKPLDLFGKKEQREDQFLKMNPAHTVPTLDDNGYCVWDSHAIMAYLVHAYGKNDTLYPKDPVHKAAVDAILHFDSGSLYNNIASYFGPYVLFGITPDPKIMAKIKDNLETVERILKNQPYLASAHHITIADITIVTTVSLLPLMDFAYETEYPLIKEYVARVKSEFPIYDEVCAKGEEDLVEFVKVMSKKQGQK